MKTKNNYTNIPDVSDENSTLLEEKDFFFELSIEKKIDASTYITLMYCLLILRSIIAQIPYHADSPFETPGLKWADKTRMSKLALSIRNSFLRDNKTINSENLVERFIGLCQNSQYQIENLLKPYHRRMWKLIDPESLVTSPINRDIYIFCLKNFGFNDPYRKSLEFSAPVRILDVFKFFSYVHPARQLEEALAIHGTIFSNRVVLINLNDLGSIWDNTALLVSDYMRSAMKAPNARKNSRMTEDVQPVYSFDDLLLDENHLKEIKSLCKTYTESKEALTFLFQGPSGVGKTTLAHAIARYMNKRLLLVKVGSADDYALRYKIEYFCELASNRNFILFFDEADSLFRTSVDKEETAGWARILFQEFKGVAIFTTNYTLPYAFDRRMTYALNMKDLPQAQKTILLKKYASKRGLLLKDHETKELASIDISPGYYENIFRLATSLNGKISYENLKKSFIRRAEFLLSEADIEKYQKAPQPHKTLYFNESQEKLLRPLETAIQKIVEFPDLFPRGLKSIFTGPPGVGKTAYAKQIADKFELDFVSLSASDILSPYVGESERNIRRILKNSDKKKHQKVIFLDEVESLLSSRDLAQRTWEFSLSNETLKRLDEYQGIILAATNRYDIIDTAFKRRFLFKIDFSYPSKEIRKKIWLDKCPKLSKKEIEIVSTYELTGADIEDISFRVINFLGFSFAQILEECRQMQITRSPYSRRIGLV